MPKLKLKPLALFAILLTTLAAAPLAPTTHPSDRDRTARPGDRLIVYFFELETPGMWWAKILDVDANGTIQIPHLGQFLVANLTPTQIEQKISDRAVSSTLLLPPEGPGPEVNVILLPERR